MGSGQVEHVKMTGVLWIACLSVVTFVSGTTSPETDTISTFTVTSPTMSTVIEPFQINITHIKSTTSSIEIEWTIPWGYSSFGYRVRYRLLDSSSVTWSPPLARTQNSFVLKHLIPDSDYNVCVDACLAENETCVDNRRQCEDFFTIPLIRSDSLIALFVTIAYILLTILIGYCEWKRKKRQHCRESDKMEPEADTNDHKDDGGPTKADLANEDHGKYLAPPVIQRPRSSIEDEDIPYITPPVENATEKNQI